VIRYLTDTAKSRSTSHKESKIIIRSLDNVGILLRRSDEWQQGGSWFTSNLLYDQLFEFLEKINS